MNVREKIREEEAQAAEPPSRHLRVGNIRRGICLATGVAGRQVLRKKIPNKGRLEKASFTLAREGRLFLYSPPN